MRATRFLSVSLTCDVRSSLGTRDSVQRSLARRENMMLSAVVDKVGTHLEGMQAQDRTWAFDSESRGRWVWVGPLQLPRSGCSF